MKKIISTIGSLALALSTLAIPQASVMADSNTIDFESPTYALGSINGQDGWSSIGPYDQAVWSSLGTTGFGSQSFRISDAVTSGGFGDQTFSKPLVNEAGETSALNDGMSGGTRQPHFEAQFDIKAIVPGSTTVMSVSPDRGDGARMSYLRFEDQADGVHVFFDDVTDPGHVIGGETFNETDIATLDASAHTIKFSMDFVDGPDNDVVKIYIDGALKITGTSWEDYYLFDTESNPSLANNSRTVDSLLFREGGTANLANLGKGYLIDNLSLLSSAIVIPPTFLKVHVLKYLDGAKATAVSANNFQFPMTATWQTANLNGGVSTSGNYALGNFAGGAPDQYQADTSAMQAPADYKTSEITDNTSQVVAAAANCAPGKYLLNGYKTSSIDFADAAVQPTGTAPVFTGLTSDQYVIVDNSTCPATASLTIEKDTIGGNGTFSFTSDIPGHTSFSITTTGTGVGSQTFTGITPGIYHVTESSQPGWTQVGNECSTIALAAGDAATCIVDNTKNVKLGLIRGTKYADRDGDGNLADGDHNRLAGVTVYLDTNNNGVLNTGEPTAITDSRGNYRFTSLAPGTYQVREVVQAGWVQTVPSTGKYDITLAQGQIAKKKNFGNFKLGTISGMKFEDKNGNGRKNNGETGLSGWTIKLTGPNGFTATTVTDSNGNYSFASLGAGIYTLVEVMQSGWHQTAHPGTVKVRSGTVFVRGNFGNQQLCPIHGHD